MRSWTPSKPQAVNIPCQNYLPWTQAPAHPLNWSGCYHLSVEPKPEDGVCEFKLESNEMAGKKCPHAHLWL